MTIKRFVATCSILLSLVPVMAQMNLSQWTFFGGLNMVYNADGAGISLIPGMGSSGESGGLSSAPTPIIAFLGAEYRRPLKDNLVLAPSVSFYSARYLWDDDRALPAEIENRTAFVPTFLIDVPVLYTIDKGRLFYSVGGGLAIALRYGFLASDVDADSKAQPAELTAGEQVSKINSYLWSGLRWLYPTLQAGVVYTLETGWRAGATLRIGIPVFNLWSNPRVSFADSMMVMLALTIKPPVKAPRTVSEPSPSRTE